MEAVLSPPAPAPFAAAPHPAPSPPSLWLRLGPIVFFEVYLNLSVALFALGPWKWPMADSTRLYGFVALAHLALLAGYLSGCRRAPRGYFGPVTSRRLMRASVALTLVLFFPTMAQYTGASGVDLLTALRDPAIVYYQLQAQIQEGGGGAVALLTYFRLLLAPLLALTMPLVARHWREASLPLKAAGVAAILSNVSLFVLTGRNKGLMDLVLLLPWLVAIYSVANRVRFSVRRLVLAGVLFLAALGAFTEYYARNSEGRMQGLDNIYWVRLLGGMEADPENFMIRGRSPTTQAVILGLSLNQTHGYYALHLALEKPWQPTWGLGHSYFLHGLEGRFTGRTTIRDASYPGRLESENGWGYSEFWHTIYPWLASDLSFPGTLLAVFLIGRLFALVWVDTLRGDNPFALGLLILLVTMLYYFPTNNIVLGFGEPWVAFWTTLAAWWLTRRPIRARAAVPAHAEAVPG